jgi:hypothetical protein
MERDAKAMTSRPERHRTELRNNDGPTSAPPLPMRHSHEQQANGKMCSRQDQNDAILFGLKMKLFIQQK